MMQRWGNIAPSGAPLRPGLTLTEVLLSVAIMGVIMTGLGSAMLIATRALPEDERPAEAILTGAAALDQLADDLRTAVQVKNISAQEVRIVVPDRTADGAPDTIHYAWSGTAGDPLTRAVNEGGAVTVIENVHAFDLDYVYESVSETYPGPLTESAEAPLSMHATAFGMSDLQVKDDKWWAQGFIPSLPESAVAWRVTRLAVAIKADGADKETTTLQIRPLDKTGWPTDVVVDEIEIPESTLGSNFQTLQYSFSDARGLSPEFGAAFVFTTEGAPSCRVMYQSGGAAPSAPLVEGDPGWKTAHADQAVFHVLFGTYFTQGAAQTAQFLYCCEARVELQVGKETDDTLTAAVQLLNTPAALDVFWSTEFDGLPQSLDINFDGDPDWDDTFGGVIKSDELTDGVWHAKDKGIQTAPEHDFDGLTTVEVRMRATTTGGSGAECLIAADTSGGQFAVIGARAELEADGTQTLTVYDTNSDSTLRTLVSLPGLSRDFVEVRLLIDPDLDTVYVEVDGASRDTHAYQKITATSSKRFASVFALGCEAEFDFVTVEVWE